MRFLSLALIVAALLTAAAMIRIWDGPVCVQCGGRLKHRDGCPLKQEKP